MSRFPTRPLARRPRRFQPGLGRLEDRALQTQLGVTAAAVAGAGIVQVTNSDPGTVTPVRQFEYGTQTPLSHASRVRSASVLGQGKQLYSTAGLQVGSIGWQGHSLTVDTLWNIRLIRNLSLRAETVYTARLSLIAADGTPEVLSDLAVVNPARAPIGELKIPDRVRFDLDAALVEQLDQGARLVVGITQKAFQPRPRRDANFAYGTTLDVTEAITGGTASASLQYDLATGSYRAVRPANGSDRRLIGGRAVPRWLRLQQSGSQRPELPPDQ